MSKLKEVIARIQLIAPTISGEPLAGAHYSPEASSLPTGSARYATMPNSAIPAISRLVAIGRRMKTSEMFMPEHCSAARQPFDLYSAGIGNAVMRGDAWIVV